MSPMLYVLIFLATVLGLEGLFLLIRGRRTENQATVRRRLRRLAGALQHPEVAARGEESILRREDRGSLLTRLASLLPRSRTLELTLYRAGLGMTTTTFFLLSAAFALGGWAVGMVFLGESARSVWLLGAGALPWLQVARLARKRMKRFEQQFPDALELLTRAMRAGHSLTVGLQMVGQELQDPVGTEFSHVAEEIKLGQDVPSALAGLSYRINVADLPFFVTAIGIQRETGGNLAEVLEKLGYVIRERFKLYGKVRALTAIGRASANILAVWPLVMVGGLYIVNPGYVAPLWEEPQGRMMALIAAILVAIGYVVCRRMAIIRV